jgi:hypothetical protein
LRDDAQMLQEDERRFADRLATAIADDLRRVPPREPVLRVVLRWFTTDDPLYFTVHALGAPEAGDVDPGDAWYPLEWGNVDAEIERAERLLTAHPELRRAGERLQQRYEEVVGDDEPSPAILEAVRRLPAAIAAAGIETHERFAVAAAQFEGYGALPVLRRLADPALLAELEARGELPDE